MVIITNDEIRKIAKILDVDINLENKLKEYLESFLEDDILDYEEEIRDLDKRLELFEYDIKMITKEHNETIERNIKSILNNYRDIFSDKTEMFEEMESFLYTQTRL
jgi:flavorubredoxin